MAMNELIGDIIAHPLPSLFVVGNLVVIESLLSVDNAAALATMVLGLPAAQRTKALRYGIFGAYIFRGLAMAFAALLMSVWWLKPLGGLYLVYLSLSYFVKRLKKGGKTAKQTHKLPGASRFTKYLGSFWAAVAMIEVMDIAFSIDNVFAAVAFTPNIILVCLGVFIGIFAMRFVAGWFVQLITRFPFLEQSAFSVIGLLGIKLLLGGVAHLLPCNNWVALTEGRNADIITSVVTIAVFALPLASSALLGFPAQKNQPADTGKGSM